MVSGFFSSNTFIVGFFFLSFYFYIFRSFGTYFGARCEDSQMAIKLLQSLIESAIFPPLMFEILHLPYVTLNSKRDEMIPMKGANTTNQKCLLEKSVCWLNR